MNFSCGLQSKPGTLSREMHANFTRALLPYPNATFSTWTAFQNLVFTGLREEQISRELYSVRDHPTRTSANIAIIPIRTQIFFFIYSLLISFFSSVVLFTVCTNIFTRLLECSFAANTHVSGCHVTRKG